MRMLTLQTVINLIVGGRHTAKITVDSSRFKLIGRLNFRFAILFPGLIDGQIQKRIC
jgi:hypothetical protein